MESDKETAAVSRQYKAHRDANIEAGERNYRKIKAYLRRTDGPVSQQDIREHTCLSDTAVHDWINRLKEAGVLERRIITTDARIYRYAVVADQFPSYNEVMENYGN